MSNPRLPDPSAFRTKESSSSIFSSMPGYKLPSTYRRRCGVRHSKCGWSNSANFCLIRYTIRLSSCPEEMDMDELDATILLPRTSSLGIFSTKATSYKGPRHNG